ncbi:YbaB/EbfC family nucleoid-associated protein [Nonomuraea roseola]|uniref:YbaB/EbfC family nucleoid-associated protein n=1 Tax=Nonomuraea roseola TaxID=46179 RepID=A0ABV5Q848_9ACTN
MDELDELRRLTELLSKDSGEADAAVSAWSTQQYTGTADHDGVVATVDAVGNLVALDISVVSKRRLDGVTLGDAVVAAVHAAEKAAATAKATMLENLRVGAGPSFADRFGEAQRSFESRSGINPDPR